MDFVMRILMVITSFLAFWINHLICEIMYGKEEDIDFEAPLSQLVWVTSILSIIVTFVVSKIMIPNLNGNTDMWWILSTIISCGTFGAAIIPEFTKFLHPLNPHMSKKWLMPEKKVEHHW